MKFQTNEQIEDMLAEVARLRYSIKQADENRKAFLADAKHAADKKFDLETADARADLETLIAKLHDFAENNLPEGKKTIAFQNGRLAFRKEPPKFFFDDQTEVSGKDSRLVDFVKDSVPEFLKVVYLADWFKLKTKLGVDSDGSVFFTDTGEVLPNVRAELVDDKFSVITS